MDLDNGRRFKPVVKIVLQLSHDFLTASVQYRYDGINPGSLAGNMIS